MEQKKNTMVVMENGINKDGGGDEFNNQQSDEYENSGGEMGCLPIHNQVMKIKKEFEKVMHPSLLRQPEMRRVLHGVNRQRRSRSPLGLPDHHQRHISVIGLERNSCRV